MDLELENLSPNPHCYSVTLVKSLNLYDSQIFNQYSRIKMEINKIVKLDN